MTSQAATKEAAMTSVMAQMDRQLEEAMLTFKQHLMHDSEQRHWPRQPRQLREWFLQEQQKHREQQEALVSIDGLVSNDVWQWMYNLHTEKTHA